MPRCLLVLVSSALLSACAANSTTSAPSNPDVASIVEYREFLAELRESLDEGVPRELSARELERYQRLDSKIHTLLAGVDNVNQLDRDDRMELFNTHEALWATVVGRNEDQLICRRVSRVGTRFKDTRCRRLSEIQASQQNAQMLMHSLRGAPESNN